jgi:uncharacterized membrane protein (DUF4010 family)
MDDEISLLGLGAALGIGLLLGSERERHKGTGPTRDAAGVRTFAIASLFGAVGHIVGGPIGVALAVAITAALTLGAYLRQAQEDPGLTSELALIVTCALGGMAQRSPAIAAAIGVAIAVLLVSRGWLHAFVRERLTERELTDAVLLAAAALVVLPFLPDRALDPLGVLNPRVVWTLAVVVMTLNAAGYVAVRALGPTAGLPLAGLAGGFVSSAATIGAMGSRARETPELRRPAVAGAALSSVATVVQLAIVVSITDSTLLRPLWPALVGSGVVALAYGGAFSIRALRARDSAPETSGRAFQPKTALVFTATVTGALLLAALLEHWFGATAGIVGVAVSGFADAHSSAVSATTLFTTGAIEPRTAVLAILLAFSTNTVTKIVVAWTTGGSRFAMQVLPGLVLMLGAAWLGGWIATLVENGAR